MASSLTAFDLSSQPSDILRFIAEFFDDPVDFLQFFQLSRRFWSLPLHGRLFFPQPDEEQTITKLIQVEPDHLTQFRFFFRSLNTKVARWLSSLLGEAEVTSRIERILAMPIAANIKTIELAHFIPSSAMPVGLESLIIQKPSVDFDFSHFSSLISLNFRFAGAPLGQLGLPDSLQRLEIMGRKRSGAFGVSRGELPSSLVSLKLGLGYSGFIEAGALPASLIELQLSDEFSQSLDFGLPRNLKFLKLGSQFADGIFDRVLPDSLTYLDLSDSSADLRLSRLPSSLITVRLPISFNKAIHPGFFPPSIEEIFFNDAFNESLPLGIFGQKLRIVKFGRDFNMRLVAGIFPRSIKELTVGYAFEHRWHKGLFPEGIEELSVTLTPHFKISPRAFPISLKFLAIECLHFTGSAVFSELDLPNLVNFKLIEQDFRPPIVRPGGLRLAYRSGISSNRITIKRAREELSGGALKRKRESESELSESESEDEDEDDPSDSAVE